MKWERWFGGGVAYFTECGEHFFKGKDVVVVGSVRQAVDEALFLAKNAVHMRMINHANKVIISGQTRKQLENRRIQAIEGLLVRKSMGVFHQKGLCYAAQKMEQLKNWKLT